MLSVLSVQLEVSGSVVADGLFGDVRGTEVKMLPLESPVSLL